MMVKGKKSFLIAVDGSKQSLEAVRYVSRLFPPNGLKIELFHVLSKIPEFFYDLGKEPHYRETIVNIRGWERALEDSIKGFMENAHDILIEAGIPSENITLRIEEREEGIARDIIRKASVGYDAVVAGRSGLSRFKDFVMGGVASKLLEKITFCGLCILGGKPQSKKILLALDESKGAMNAVDYVAKIYGGAGCQVNLFHVVRGFGVFENRQESTAALGNEKGWIETGKAEMESVFEKARNRLIKAGFEAGEIGTKVVTGVSSRSGAILKESKEGKYGTIVLGRRGLSKVRNFLMGRVSSKVVQLAKKQAVWIVN